MSLWCHTLCSSAERSGVALHCGREVTLQLHPDERAGVRFRRVDLPGLPEVEAKLENVVATRHATVLQSGEAIVSTTEHLLAALWTSGATHVRVDLDGPEVPILDGSAQDWIEALREAELAQLSVERPIVSLSEPAWFAQGDVQILGLPPRHADEKGELHVAVAVEFEATGAGEQTFEGPITSETFARELAPARTFALEAWLPMLREAGLIQGGSTDNAIVFDENGPSSPLRFPNELARHKALDLLGDGALGWNSAWFSGQIIALRAGHGSHLAWLRKAMLKATRKA